MPLQPDVVEPVGPSRRVRVPSRRRSAVRLAVLAGFLGALVWALAAQWGAVRPLLGQLSMESLAAAASAVLAGVLATFLCWRAVLAGLAGLWGWRRVRARRAAAARPSAGSP